MSRLGILLTLVAFVALCAPPPTAAQTCAIGGHNETSESFAPGGWTTAPATP
mgnify:FL=1